jgi:hypothetical protein
VKPPKKGARPAGKQSAPETNRVKRQSRQTRSKSSQETLRDSNRRATVRQIGTVFETPENWTIYRRPDLTDPTFVELCDSIRKSGITTPLEISSDGYIISGHRRYYAAKQCGLPQIPCFIDHTVVMDDLTVAERVTLLTERNKGIRIKTDGELYLEAAAAVDPAEAVRKAQARKYQVLNKVKTCGLSEVATIGNIRRTDPSGERADMLNAVLEIMAELRSKGFLPTSGRSIHYKLLAKNVLTSKRKGGYIYGTRPGSSALLSKLLTDARSAGLIDPDDLDDGTRPSHQFVPSGSVGNYVNETLNGLFANYFSDIHADQPNHVELLVEKNTIFPLIRKHVANELRLPITSLRGYGSFPAARDVAERFKRSGKGKLVVVYVSDLDPEGIDMPASWKKYLWHDFHVEAAVYRATVTLEQVRKYHLPPDADVKLSSSRARKFIQEHGDQCWELDSMPEQILIDEVSTAARAMLDIDALNRAFEREREGDIKLARIEAGVRSFITDKFAADLRGAV